MLQLFFAFFIIFLIIVFVKIIIPLCRYLVISDAIIQLYFTIFIAPTETNYENSDIIIYMCNNYVISFSNLEQAIEEFEKLLEKSFEYYDKLGNISNFVNEVQINYEKLIDISNEIEMLKKKIVQGT